MPVSHSHQFLCVSLPLGIRVRASGLAGSVDVPDFVRLPAERAQQIDRVRVALGQRSCRRRRAPSAPPPCSPRPSMPGICARYFGCFGSVTSTIEVPLNSAWPLSGLTGFGTAWRPAVMADIGDVAVALLVDDRLVGAARLQVVVADEPHVPGFRRIADLRRLRERGQSQQSSGRASSPQPAGCGSHGRSLHRVSP